jgi:hypothetical protein
MVIIQKKNIRKLKIDEINEKNCDDNKKINIIEFEDIVENENDFHFREIFIALIFPERKNEGIDKWTPDKFFFFKIIIINL